MKGTFHFSPPPHPAKDGTNPHPKIFLKKKKTRRVNFFGGTFEKKNPSPPNFGGFLKEKTRTP